MNRYSTFLTALLITLSLAACSSGGGAGGDATQSGDGDGSDADPVAVNLILPFVGLYALPRNWAGTPESDAYLDIQVPASNGIAIVLLKRVSALNNCIERRPSQGEAVKDPFSQRVFLNDLFDFENSVLSLSGTTLVISLSEDVNDIDGDTIVAEAAQLRADIFEADLPETCQL